MSDNGAAAVLPVLPAWMGILPEDMRSDQTLQSFKGDKAEDVLPVLAKSYVESRKMIGKKAYDLPQDDWKPEQYATWNKAIGVPDSADKYELPADELMTQAGMPKDAIIAANKKFHELGLTPRQVKGLVNDWYLKDAAAGNEVLSKQKSDAAQAAASAIQQEYGDKFEAKKGLVKSVLALGGGDLAERLEVAGFGNDPALFKALVAIGEKTMEDSSRRGGSVSPLGPESMRAEALQKIQEIKAARIADPRLSEKFDDPRSAEFRQWKELHQKACTS